MPGDLGILSPPGSRTEVVLPGRSRAASEDEQTTAAANRTGPDRTSATPKPSLLGLNRRQLTDALQGLVDRSFRVDQIYRALHELNLRDFEQMSNLPASLRGELSQRFSIDPLQVAKEHRSADGTVKYLFRLHDGATIEAVDIPEGRRRTLCLSSQAGCALACRFCVTGYWGGGRNLSAGEIVAQVQAIRRRERPDTHGLNLVFMGMGEPLLNLEGLQGALDILLQQISWRRVTISTAGVLPGLDAMARWKPRPRLAISLHAPDDDRRGELMPINRKYPLAELMQRLRSFPLGAKERITFEYILIRDFNDSQDDARALSRLLSGLPAKVNLIPLNPDPVLGESMRPPSVRRTDAFRRTLEKQGLVATVRRRRGDDISAACGQLRAPDRNPRGFRRSNLSL